MTIPKANLRTVLCGIGVIAYSLGTLSILRYPSFRTLKIVELIMVVSLLFAVLGARFIPGKSGEFWFGYAVWGVPNYVYVHNNWQFNHLVHDLMSPLAVAMHYVPTTNPFAALSQGEQFEIIGAVYDDLFAFWMAGLGGLVAMFLAWKYRRPN
jgi:hypothetical protein